MKTVRIHEDNEHVGVNVTGGSNYTVRVRWATDQGLLAIPPVGVRTPATYSETPPLFVTAVPTADNPAFLPLDPVWWQTSGRKQRNLFAVLEFHGTANANWQHFEDFQFIINHDPVANAGPDQVVALDPMGRVVADVQLDATASDDPDLHAALSPAPGPLHYRWWPESLPAAIARNGVGWVGAYDAANHDDPSPVLLAANTVVPASDRGEYRMRLYVEDNDPATLGRRVGQVGVDGASVRVLIASAGNGLQILSPLAASPAFRSFERDRFMDIRIYYRINEDILNDPAYADGWFVRCRIWQEKPAPSFALLSQPAGSIVFDLMKPPIDREGFFTWDGRQVVAGIPRAIAVGSFSIELELLDALGQSTAVVGNTAYETNAIVIDFLLYVHPVALAFPQTAMNGAFMESGHAGKFGTRLHTGMDMVPTGGAGIPDVVASRSGFWHLEAAATNDLRIEHEAPELTHYLHADPIAKFNAGDLVLQGERLGTMSSKGANGNVHLHFEYYQDLAAAGGALMIRNPLQIMPLVDTVPPQIEDAFIRSAPANGAADLTRAASNIGGVADLIVRGRDRANAAFASAVQNGPYGMTVVDDSGRGVFPEIKFDSMTQANQCSEYFETTGIFNGVNIFDPAHQFLPYLRWDTAAYAGQVSPLTLHVRLSDFFGHRSAAREINVGAMVAIIVAPPTPATSSAAPKPFQLTMAISNRGAGLTAVNSDTFAISLQGAPVGWTLAAGTTSGAVANGTTKNVVVRVNPNGVAPAGNVAFALVVASGILTHVAATLPVTVTIS